MVGTADASGREKPRVLLILTEFPPRLGGMQTHALYLSNELHRRGYEIEVVTYRVLETERRQASELDAGLPFPVRRVLSRLGFWHNVDTIRDRCRHFHPALVYSSTIFYGLLAEELGVPVVCRSVGNDVLRPWLAYPFRPGSRVLNAPILERRLFDLFQRLRSPEWLETVFREARRELMRRAARAATRILANSAFTADLLATAGVPFDRVEVVVGGVDARRFAPPEANRPADRARLGLPVDRFLLLTVCRLEPKKGVEHLLGAFTTLRQRMPDAHLAIVGDGRHALRQRELAAALGLDGSVTFCGAVAHEEVHSYYWCADLFVLASREWVHPATGVRDAETMGRVLCEANAAGLPVLTTRSGGIPSVITSDHNGLLVDPDDEAALVEQIGRLRRDDELRSTLVRNGLRAASRRFDWSVVLEAHERAFAAVLSGTARFRDQDCS
ncbi:MAG: glycosyltransferase family 4 protein [Chloroflexi bacterium]|nr:glycosyltransferase family 4 protein [Chloroflexota bacterium]